MRIAALEQEKSALMRERDLGAADEERIAEIETTLATAREGLAALEGEWASERKLVEEIQALRAKLAGDAEGAEKARQASETAAAAERSRGSRPGEPARQSRRTRDDRPR